MHHRPLGRTGLQVSAVCLGTMTWGNQNTEAEAHAQLDLALDHGIDFIDTAEMYAVPPTAETYGKTETYIGTWLAARGRRDRIVLATKVVGPGSRFPYVRDGNPRLDARNINAAVDASLKRLQTDYIDLYQLHWPDRNVNTFGQLGWAHQAEEEMIHPEETLEALAALIRAGKIRHVGLSNETPWGVMTFLQLAAARGLPRVASIQNPYSLLNRSFEVGLAEIAMREDCGLLAYAPLGAGMLTGKYLGGARPPGSRMVVFNQKLRYDRPRGHQAVARYVEVARRHGLDPAQMAIAYVLSRPFTTAAIIGATSLAQLETDVASIEVTLGEAVLADLEAVHDELPYPCP
jgi:aryl-alcohol dehydrogenase-like predicted oxidoreductase